VIASKRNWGFRSILIANPITMINITILPIVIKPNLMERTGIWVPLE
jgi:hypothetical protein